MAITVEVIDERGTTTNLSDGTITWFGHIDGTGVAPVRRIPESGPKLNGEVDRGFRLAPRQMILHLFAADDSAGSGDTARDAIAQIFAPTANPINLKVTRDDAEVRQIDVYLNGELDFPMSNRKSTGRQDILVPLIAHDPTWYNPTQQSNTVDLSSGSGLFSQTAVGLTWFDWIIFEATGPLTSLSISHNSFSSSSLSFSGNTIAALETYTIDMRPGFKTILDSSDTNQLDKITTSSVPNMFGNLRVWDEKYLAAYGLGAPTSNAISMSASSTTGASEVVVKWYKRYISL